MTREGKAMWPFTLGMFLLVAMGGQASRDPFRPVVSPCLPATSSTFTWQLRGIVGQEQDFRALLTGAKGMWVQRREGDALDERWRLLDVRSLSITVEDSKGCQPVLVKALKGSLYEKDDLPAADVLPAAVTGGKRPAVPGI